jgi:hypothetical protein
LRIGSPFDDYVCSARFRWDSRTGAPLSALDGHSGELLSAIYSPDGTRILSLAADRTARRWDIGWTVIHGQDLRTRVCREKLVGAARFTVEEARDPIIGDSAAPIRARGVVRCRCRSGLTSPGLRGTGCATENSESAPNLIATLPMQACGNQECRA